MDMNLLIGLALIPFGTLYLLGGWPLGRWLLPLLAALGGVWLGRGGATALGVGEAGSWMAGAAVAVVTGALVLSWPSIAPGAAGGALAAIVAAWVATIALPEGPARFWLAAAATLVVGVVSAKWLPARPVVAVGTALFGARTIATGLAILLGRATFDDAGRTPLLEVLARDPLWLLGILLLTVVGAAVQMRMRGRRSGSVAPVAA